MKEMDFERKVLSEKIVEFKKRNNLTYQQIGEALGVDKSYLNRVVKLTSHMSMPVLIRLAKFMKIPLFALFIPSAELLKEEFLETACEQLNNLQLSKDELAEKTGISPIRMIEIFHGNTVITEKEYNLLSDALNISKNSVYQEDNLSIMESTIRNLNLSEQKKENILKYIKENLE